MTSAVDVPAGTPPPPRVLVGGTLVDGSGSEPRSDAVVVLRDGRVDCAGDRETCPVPEGIEVIDVSVAISWHQILVFRSKLQQPTRRNQHFAMVAISWDQILGFCNKFHRSTLRNLQFAASGVV